MISPKTGEKKISGAKAKKQAATLVVVKDISLAEVPDYLSSALVGRFCGKIFGEAALRNWMEEHSNTHLWQLPMLHIMSRGWILFHVKTEADRQTLLDKNWHWGNSGLILKKWSMDFDANRELQNVQRVWTILPGLPMMFWKKEIMEAIGSKIGKFIGRRMGTKD